MIVFQGHRELEQKPVFPQPVIPLTRMRAFFTTQKNPTQLQMEPEHQYEAFEEELMLSR